MDGKVSIAWYEWMLENFVMGFSVSDLVKKVVDLKPHNQAEIILAIQSIENHPLLSAVMNQDKKLKRREWLLNSLDSLAHLDVNSYLSIESVRTPSFDDFIKKYYSKNKPVVLSGGMAKWPAMEKWTPEYLKNNFGGAPVEVQRGRDKSANYEVYSSQYREKILMNEFVDMVVEGGKTNNYYMTGNNTKENVSVLSELYKDVGDFGEGYRKMTTHCRENLFWFGPEGVFTPLHFDTFNIILAQVYGRKKVTLIPACQIPKVYNDLHVYSKSQFPAVDYKKFPKMKNITPIDVVLHPGEALFIPVGWWHCVEGLDVSMSVSFTNFNVENGFYESFPR